MTTPNNEAEVASHDLFCPDEWGRSHSHIYRKPNLKTALCGHERQRSLLSRPSREVCPICDALRQNAAAHLSRAEEGTKYESR